MRPQNSAAVTDGEHKTCVRTCQHGNRRARGRVDLGVEGFRRRSAGSRSPRAARTNAATRPGSLRPGDDSTPLATSTIHGRTWPIRPATFSGVRPPARMRLGRGGRTWRRSGGDRVPGPSGLAGDMGIDEHGVGGAAQLLRPAQIPQHARDRLGVSEAERADDAEVSEGDEVGRRLVPVQLDGPQPDAIGQGGDLIGRTIDEQAHRVRGGGEGGDDLRGERGLDPTGGARVEVQADPVGTTRDTGQGIARRWSGRRP